MGVKSGWNILKGTVNSFNEDRVLRLKVRWSDVWIGSFGTALLFTAGKFLLGLYLGREGTTSAYGAGAAFVLILMYIYYSSLILFFGAEFTQVYAHRDGKKVEPTKYAEPVTSDARAEQGMPREGRKTGAAPHRDAPGRQAMPAMARTSSAGFMSKRPQDKEDAKPLSLPRRPPLEQIKAEPWSFVGLALTVGVAAGLVFRMKAVRKALKVYGFARKFA
jgi:hypothetical protein